MNRIFIIKEKIVTDYTEINEENIQSEPIFQETGKFLILNVDNDEDAENLLGQGAWEMPAEQVQEVFRDKAYLASNATCEITVTETGYDVVFTEPAINIEEVQAQLTQIVQAYMDKTAQARGYDNIHTACSYANSTDPVFNREGNACLAWRDAVWRKCYIMLDEFRAGTRDIPTAEELIAELPALDWGDE